MLLNGSSRAKVYVIGQLSGSEWHITNTGVRVKKANYITTLPIRQIGQM